MVMMSSNGGSELWATNTASNGGDACTGTQSPTSSGFGPFPLSLLPVFAYQRPSRSLPRGIFPSASFT
ncbi:hypothetical protein CYMTET_53005 [Cymbomonas tetramitiformis]|uniref:Uncharacterized protein n=1 Tax=Cymbomonas tetramitiformis TaxID=36881 RepID=A0AAE0BI47_9CHLO|nr:hypothetical protein CYMTET_53005 [Cymbomonas tetramitiformis]